MRRVGCRQTRRLPPFRGIALTYHQITRPGSRPVNEDAVAIIEHNGSFCFVVADGLGGHGKGEVASQLLVEVFQREFAQENISTEAFLCRAFDAAQEAILARQKAQHAAFEMKTTAVALSIIGDRCRWGHIGDSRLYYFHKSNEEWLIWSFRSPYPYEIRADGYYPVGG